MSQYHLRWGGLASLFGVFSIAIAPVSAGSDVLLTQAAVESFRNRVDIWLRGGLTRPVRASDHLGFGDAIQTRQSSQADLRLNDGSLARVGEFTTFWFLPNTRDLRLAQGTALLNLTAAVGVTTVETPNVIVDLQDTAIVVRHVRPGETAVEASIAPGTNAAFPAADGRTAVMVLTAGPSGAVQVSLRDGRSVKLAAGQMAIVDHSNLYMFEFDRALFYETSALVQGLPGDPLAITGADSAVDAGLPNPNDETQPPLEITGDYWVDPKFLAPDGSATEEGGWLFPTEAADDSAADDSTAETTSASPESPHESATDSSHDTSNTDIELTPSPEAGNAPAAPLAPGEQSSEDNTDVPAGVIVPPSSAPPPVEPPSEQNPPNPPETDVPESRDRPMK